MKYCSNCNTQNSDIANFCRRCGFAFPETFKGNSGSSTSGNQDVEELVGSINDYESEIEELKEVCEKLRNENASLSKANGTLQQNLSKIKKTLTNAEEKIEDLKRENEELQKSKNKIHLIYILGLIVLIVYVTFSINGATSGNDSQLSNSPNQLSQQNEAIIIEEEEDVSYENHKIFDVVEQQPTFPGGQSALMSWLSDNIQYPADAEENGIEGRVVVSFVVESDGSISNVQITRGVDPSLDKEAARVISNMPKWIPGKQDGQPVPVKYNIPITFKLQ